VVTVVGIGNVLWGDDGAGVWLVREFARACRFTPAIDVIDGGTLGLGLVAYLLHTDRLLIVDAAKTGKPPGCVSTLFAGDVPAVLRPIVSTHDASVNDLLAALALLERSPKELAVVGIEPFTIVPSVGLSECVRAAMPTAEQTVVDLLASWGVVSRRHDVPVRAVF
jgi:hydrogenase maturation protease